MSNQETYEEMCQKAKAYDYLIGEIEEERQALTERLAQCEKDLSHAWDSMAASLVGRKYAYMEILETMERWVENEKFVREQYGL